jgi:hypothetical protein
MMAIFKKGQTEDLVKLYAEKIAAEAQVKAAQEEITRLRSQVDRLQEALVATTAPRAYEDRRVEQTSSPVDVEELKKRRREAEINAELLYGMEQPTFKDADDMIEMLTGSADFGKSTSLHSNNES